ncbi:hypothetical protein LEP1GSC035_0286 [Leptospira noguchii str. 2007001578]|uniref:Uncharacterized protein n=1 Tax=Leptospira noguchii str. 2007001578 TaxID=1049974 RepID=A0ABN0IVL7_9LEPT|nr:hypothetical protein LEP1GSC035_0286 [Leptospira noguchii str. 2007001578]
MFYEISLYLNFILLFHFLWNIRKEYQNTARILFLKSQLVAYKRKKKKFHTKPLERFKLVILSYLDRSWKENLILISPATLLEWRKKSSKSFGHYFREEKTGRPNIPWNIIKLIRRVAKETISGERPNSTVSYKNLVTIFVKEPFRSIFQKDHQILKTYELETVLFSSF